MQHKLIYILHRQNFIKVTLITFVLRYKLKLQSEVVLSIEVVAFNVLKSKNDNEIAFR